MWHSLIRRWRRHFVSILAAVLSSLLVAPTAMGATAEAVDRSSLRVCADPGNLPFSNQAGEGFENKIAELLAAELGVPLRYTWFPQATGFVRNTLMARKCDLVIGISLGFELLQNTNPYYHSSYALVYRADSGLEVSSLDDPILKEERLGVIAGTPPSSLIAKYGLLGQVRPYHLVADTRFNQPGKRMVDDIAKGEVDVGALWGPIAGYYAKDHNPTISVVPLVSKPGEVKMDYRITMGIRFNEPDWKHEINNLIEKKQPEIDAILKAYGVPLLDARGQPLRN
jgi:quinoprotein dehydrogenase-associated probable ABC transporter substrate-binding protein